jgi:transposase
MEAIAKRCAGLDVHRRIVVGTILLEQTNGSLQEETRSFGTFRKHREALVQWLTENKIELTTMESTSVYYKSIYGALEAAGLKAQVVNARHVKNVPGRKTDVKDSQWLASLTRFGLLRPSFIPPEDLRELRLVARYRLKLQGILAGEKNRLHKVLDDGGIRLGTVVSDIQGVSAREMIDGLLAGKPVDELVKCARGRLKDKTGELRDSLEGGLSERHQFVLKRINAHIESLEKEIAEMDAYLFKAMEPYKQQWELLQTLPGVDTLSAAILVTELGVDMEHFGSSAQLASWAGMSPGNNESAGKRKSGKTPKGSPTIRRVLCEVSNAARKTNSQFKGKYAGLVIRRGHKRSIVAVGHKLLRVIYAMLNTKQPYKDPELNYEALVVKRNAARWIRALKDFGHLPSQPSTA